jgi:pantothenate kinase-related protein Tda10
VDERDVAPVALGDGESQDVLIRRILPTWTKDAARQEHPVVVIVCGQPGAGKDLIGDLIQAVLDRRGGAVRIGSHLYKRVHPRYAELLAADVRTAGVKVRPDTHRWQAAVEEYVRAQHFDAVVESAAADPDEFCAFSAACWRPS